MGQQRLFLGSYLAAAQSDILRNLPCLIDPILTEHYQCRLRYVSAEKLHITWIFFGLCDIGSEVRISKEIVYSLAGMPSFSIEYTRLASFGASPDRPHALVLLPKEPHFKALALGRAARSSLGRFCQKQEHEFRPHLTIARFPREIKVRRSLPEIDLGGFLPLQQQVDRICLLESHFGPSGSDYRTIAEFRLGE